MSGAPPSKNRRCVLEPGRLYRIDVRMRWSDTLWEVDDQGNKKVLKQQAADGTTDSLRQYWFRTAPLQPAGGAPGEGTAARFAFLHHRRDLFDPAMLQRHLLGYDPAQSELQRFANDAEAASGSQATINERSKTGLDEATPSVVRSHWCEMWLDNQRDVECPLYDVVPA